MDFTPHTTRFRKRFAELEDLLGSPTLYDDPASAQKLTKEHSRLKAALAAAAAWEKIGRDLADNREMASGNDPDLAQMAKEEIPSLEARLPLAERELLTFILPADPHEDRNTIVEIRAGTGGDEAGLFAADLFRMYSRYAERTGWKLDVMDCSPGEAGGYKEIIFSVVGTNVFRALRFESGVHRVQRVPATENQGRIHTSAATVAVLPEAEEVDIELKPDDLRIEVCRAGGPGGQGVNTTDSAVQVLHKPTGMIVRCQDGRSQLKNKEKALNILRTRLLEQKQAEEAAKYAAHRKKQIGTGDRNEKIRTYNYPQNRITDHRINYTMHNLSGFMEGDIGELLAELQSADFALKLAELDPVA
ncbi:MAG: peptide chain release factor 1 [Candidatus Methylacidiphilales bacterium]|nr:peptide chain release factor 1 [Candidatus Methylacidiphilales bacterium]